MNNECKYDVEMNDQLINAQNYWINIVWNIAVYFLFVYKAHIL